MVRPERREAVADQTRAEADPDHAHLLLQARNPRAPVAVEQEPHGRETEPEVDQRKQRLMDQQEDVQEHAEDAGHRGQVAQRADLGDREVGLPQRHRQHQHEVEQVRREHPGHESDRPEASGQHQAPAGEGALLGEDAREREQGREEELPDVGDALEQLQGAPAAGDRAEDASPRASPGEEGQGGQDRPQAAPEQGDGHEPVEPLPRVLAKNHDPEDEHQPAEAQIQRGKDEVGVHRPPGPGRSGERRSPKPSELPTGEGPDRCTPHQAPGPSTGMATGV